MRMDDYINPEISACLSAAGRPADSGWTKLAADARAVIIAYEKSMTDEKAKIPTYLVAALEALRRV